MPHDNRYPPGTQVKAVLESKLIIFIQFEDPTEETLTTPFGRDRLSLIGREKTSDELLFAAARLEKFDDSNVDEEDAIDSPEVEAFRSLHKGHQLMVIFSPGGMMYFEFGDFASDALEVEVLT